MKDEFDSILVPIENKKLIVANLFKLNVDIPNARFDIQYFACVIVGLTMCPWFLSAWEKGGPLPLSFSVVRKLSDVKIN